MKSSIILCLMFLAGVIIAQEPPKEVFFITGPYRTVETEQGIKIIVENPADVIVVDGDDHETLYDLLESTPNNSIDTIEILNTENLYLPEIINYREEFYYCFDRAKNALTKISLTGAIVNQVNLINLVEQVRGIIGSMTPDQFLKKNNTPYSLESHGLTSDHHGYNTITISKAHKELSPRGTIPILIRAFEIDSSNRATVKITAEEFPLIGFEALLEFDRNLTLVNAYRLPVLNEQWGYNVNAIHFIEDSLIVIPVFPSSKSEENNTPSFVQLKYSENEQLEIDKYYETPLTQFIESDYRRKSFFKPIFFSLSDSQYYIDQNDMCFYKVGDSEYQWCIPDIPTSTFEEIWTHLKVKTPIEDFKVINDSLHMWLSIYEHEESQEFTLHKFIFDLANKTVIDRQYLFDDRSHRTSGTRVIDGTYHKLIVDPDDTMKIVVHKH